MRSWLKLTTTFIETEFLQKVRIEQYQSYPLFAQSGGEKGFNPFEMIPNNFDEYWRYVSLEERFRLICCFAANGDFKETERLYFEEDYADVFHHYVINSCRGK